MCAIALAMPASSTSATNEPQETNPKVVSFLKQDEELQRLFTCRFTGAFRSIPPDLRTDLKQAFPMYDFYVARMRVFLDLPPKNYDLIVIADAKTGDVAAYVWAIYWSLPPSESFERLLQGQQASSEEDALHELKVLAELIAFTNNDGVGKGTIERGKLKVELLRGDGVFRILEVKLNKKLRLGRLSITRLDGKKPRYFV